MPASAEINSEVSNNPGWERSAEAATSSPHSKLVAVSGRVRSSELQVKRMMTQPASTRWALSSLVIVFAALMAGCTHTTKALQKSCTSMRNEHLKCLVQPSPAPNYCASNEFYGYYGTCWRPWPDGWTACNACCLAGAAAVTDNAAPLEAVPAVPDGEARPLPPTQPEGAQPAP